MSYEIANVSIGETFLEGTSVIVLFDLIGGAKQVSTFVMVSGEKREVFSLKENEQDIGPVRLNRINLPEDKIESLLKEYDGRCEKLSVEEARVTERSFLYGGAVETVIYAIDLFGSDGKKLTMRLEGAAYPYTLALI